MRNTKNISKFLSLVLRHKPETIRIELSEDGWIGVDKLIQKLNEFGKEINFDTLCDIVENNDKKRFAFNDDQTMIRANQGHSVKVDLGYEKKDPPMFLYHGTAEKNMNSIIENGLMKGKRHHVHLSKDSEVARSVGQRHGKPVVLQILAGRMNLESYSFFESDNGVWLTDHVPSEYLILDAEELLTNTLLNNLKEK